MEKKKKVINVLSETATDYKASSSTANILPAYGKLFADDHKMMHAASQGVAAKAIGDFSNLSGRSKEEVAGWLYITPKTIRNYEAEGKALPVLQSEILLKLFSLYNKGISVFSDVGSFNSWLKLPAQGLYQEVPEALLSTFTGISLVEDELTRIEYGEFA